MAEWNFELRTGGPDYFWNRVCLYIGRHEQRLETQELGPLRVEVPRDLRAPRTDVLDANYAVLATVLTDLPPALTEEEIAAFLDPNLPGPKTVRLPHYVKLFWCSLAPLAADRLAVHIETLIDEAEPYVRAMLAGLGFTELCPPTECEPTQPQTATQPLGTYGGTLERVKDARALYEQGIPKTTACKRAHIDPRTYDRYVEEFIDWVANPDE